jgi:hypothetical protein
VSPNIPPLAVPWTAIRWPRSGLLFFRLPVEYTSATQGGGPPADSKKSEQKPNGRSQTQGQPAYSAMRNKIGRADVLRGTLGVILSFDVVFVPSFRMSLSCDTTSDSWVFRRVECGNRAGRAPRLCRVFKNSWFACFFLVGRVVSELY